MLFIHGVQAELNRLKWENELYQRELLKYQSALHNIHQLVHTIPNSPEPVKRAVKIIMEAVGA